MPEKLRVVQSNCTDPTWNLAIEEWLMKHCKSDEAILFLWQNERTVVIGRNQNPYRECPIQRLDEEGITLVRRLTGGGAVYHDLGNLNFTFLFREDEANLEINLKILIHGLKNLGIFAEYSGRNDLHVDGKKVSGSAFCTDYGVFLHHGTLLVDVNLEEMVAYLSVSPLKLLSKGIESVRSRVVNLKEIKPDITLDLLRTALIHSFEDHYSLKSTSEIVDLRVKELTFLRDRYLDWQWNFGESPKYTIALEHKGSMGLHAVELLVEDGMIFQARISTDALETNAFDGLQEKLIGIPFKRKTIESAAAKLDLDSIWYEELNGLWGKL